MHSHVQYSKKNKIPDPRITGNFSSDSLVRLKDYINVMGLNQRQFAALLGGGHVIGDDQDCAGLYCRCEEYQN